MESMSQSTTSPIPYEPQLFVDREQEVALVAGIARQISAGEANQARAVVFHGGRGLGKTWLALHLNRTILPTIPGVTSLLINLFPSAEGSSSQENEWFAKTFPFLEKLHPETTTRAIVEWVAEKVEATMVPEASLREITAWLAQEVEQK